MNLDILKQLQSPLGTEALAAATALSPTIQTFLQASKRLQKQYPSELARAAIDTVMLRQKGRTKFTRADQMFFTREALEQASSEIVSRHRLRRFSPYPIVGDFCCGIGGDTLALAELTNVVAIDRDPVRLAMAEHNLNVYELGHRATFVQGDLLTMPLPDVPAVFFDPDRRTDSTRHVSLRHYRPSLDALRSRLSDKVAFGVKLAPAVSWAEIGPYEAEVEFISVEGELKECVLWLGSARTWNLRRATLLPSGATLRDEVVAPAPAPGPPRALLYDPDPAILRAGLVTNLAVELGAHQIDPEIAYLTADDLKPTPLARAYRIEEAFPFHVVHLKETLRARGVGRVTIQRRGSAVDPVKLTKQLKLAGPEHRWLFLTRVLDRPFALIAQPI